MAFQPSKGAEPIPGYTLRERLGTGGYGEVWSATAPGDLTKAIKFVYGNIDAAQAEQELKALSRIREVRHPFLLSLERFEILDNQLVIVTELAEMSLYDRFQACRAAGLPGIPRDELLVYIGDAADALDYMHERYGLQHLDIKPQNLLLVGGRIKVADFGLVKDVKSTSATATGGVTPVYATPEAFDGRISRNSDQYSLAIVYQEMLTGVRPFPGTTALQLAVQHMYSPPMLDPLPPLDRPAIARALAKVADERFESCRQMIGQLRDASKPVATTAAPADDQTGPSAVVDADFAPTQIGKPTFEDQAVVTPNLHEAVTLAGPRQVEAVSKVALRPTLFLGIGGVATRVLRQLKVRLAERFETLANVPIFRLLLFDTDRDSLRQARLSDFGKPLDVEETVLLPLHPTEHYRQRSKELLKWIDRRWFFGIPRSLHTDGIRALGRLAFVENASEATDRLREAIARLASPRSKSTTVAATQLALRDQVPRIFVVASVSGGTGSGMLIDVAYTVRRILGDLSLPTDGVCAILLFGTGRKPGQQQLARASAVATLQELAHFDNPTNAYTGGAGVDLPTFESSEPPFQDVYVVHLGDDLNDAALDAGAEMVAEYLFLDAASACGPMLDGYRRQTQVVRNDVTNPTRLRSFGLHRISFPRLRLAKAAAQLLCRRLVDRWRGQLVAPPERSRSAGAVTVVPTWARAMETDPMHDEMRQRAERWTQQVGLTVDAIAERLELGAGAAHGKPFETEFAEAVSHLPRPDADAHAIGAVLKQLDELLGAGAIGAEFTYVAPSPVARLVAQQTNELGEEIGRLLLEWISNLVNQPSRRLRCAQYAADWLAEYVPTTIESLEARLTEMHDEVTSHRQRIAAGEIGDKTRWFGKSRPQPSEVVEQHLLGYCRHRLREILLHHTLGVLHAVHGKLGLCREYLTLLRRRLDHFVDAFAEESAGGPAVAGRPSSATHLRELFPFGAANLAEAAVTLVEKLGPEALDAFDVDVQTAVIEQKGGLLGYDFDNADLAEELRGELFRRAVAVVLKPLEALDAAALFYESHSSADHARKAFAGSLLTAKPRVAVPGGWQHLLLAVPEGSAGARIRELTLQQIGDLPKTVAGGNPDGDVIVCIEAAGYALPQVVRFLTDNDPSYVELANKVLTRKDLAWMPLS
jgi:hypothetical protein